MTEKADSAFPLKRIAEVDHYLDVSKVASTKARSLLRFENVLDFSVQLKVEKLQLIAKVTLTDTNKCLNVMNVCFNMDYTDMMSDLCNTRFM